MKKGDEIELSISSLAFGGSGIGRVMVDDRSFTVFVEDTVPGDVVKVRIGTKKKKYAYGYVLSFIKKSPQRIAPRCKHFGSFDENGVRKVACGGCALQFLTYEDQLQLKEQHVKDAITRIGGFAEDLVKPIIGVKDPWFYRNKMEFSFSWDKNEQLDLGLHLRRMHYDVIELEECFLMNSYIGDFIKTVRTFFRSIGFAQPIEGGMALKSLVIREGKHTGEVMVNLIVENAESKVIASSQHGGERISAGSEELLRRSASGNDDLAYFFEGFKKVVIDFFEKVFPQKKPQEARPELAQESNQKIYPQLTSLYFTNVINRKGSAKKIHEKLLWGEPVIHDHLHLPDGKALTFQISPQAFFQPNTLQAEVLYAQALQAAALTGKETIFDLFCGAGTIGIFCSKFAQKVIGIELNESAIQNARTNAQLNHIQNIEFLVGDVGKRLPELLAAESGNSQKTLPFQPDVIIVDPPRNGLEEKVVEQVASFNPKRIVYVSCSPPSLARDLKLFQQKNYHMISVQPVDMFPQTYHIECVGILEKV